MADRIRTGLTDSAHEIPELDRDGLRRFALTTGAIVAALFGAFFPWLFERALPVWPWLVFGVLGVWALIAPTTLRVVYRGWMRVGLLLNRVTTPIVIGVLFVALIVPIALILRAAGSDPMQRVLDRTARTYRIPSEKPPHENLERPF